MGKMLGREMTLVERSSLINMIHHPGFDVLKEMMHQHCRFVTDEVIKLDPVNEGTQFQAKLRALQITARATNDFCSSLLKSIDVLQNAEGLAMAEQETINQIKSQLENRKQPE